MSRNEENRVAYDAIARIYAGEEPTEDDAEMRAAVRGLFTERLPGPQVLEVGCGPGTDSGHFLTAGLRVTATDFSSEFVEIARGFFPELDVRAMDMRSLSFDDDAFDGVYGFASLIHLERHDVPATLAEFRRVLRPGGVLLLSLIESSSVDEYTIDNWGGQPDNSVLFTCWEPGDFVAQLREAGFENVERFRVSSRLYEELPRLVERGVRTYQIAAR